MDIDAREEVEVVARRHDFLVALADDPLHKPDLVERLGHSRSTVDRAIDELTEAGLVERLTPGYVTTQVGQLAADRYREYLAGQETVFGAADALSEVPHDVDLPATLVDEGRVVTTDARYRLFELVADRLQDAGRFQAMLPSLSDSRHVRLCHDWVIREGLETTLVAPPTALSGIREEFPHLADELSGVVQFTAYSGEVPDYGLLLTDVEADSSERGAVALVSYESGDISGFVHTDAPAAVEWGESVLADTVASAREATDDLADATAASTLPPLAGGRFPATLRDEGFVRVDDDYFERREPLDPTTAWRSGLGLPEVEAGYAAPRHKTDADRPLAAELTERLTDGEHVALVGPAGAGKSTVCKRVACQWTADGDVVLYRESGSSRAFESVGALEATLDRATGQTLIVVEDAIRSEASAVFDLMRRVAGREDVAVLVDAREDEWREPDGAVDARLEAYRREHVETVTMPSLSTADCKRLLDRVREVTGEPLDVPVDELLDEVRTDAVEDGPVPAHAVLLLFHRLSRYVEPLAGYEGREAPTTLDEDVARVRADLEAAGETATDVGLLVTLLTAGGVGVTPAHAHALATDERDRTEVEAALDCLDGEVLFGIEGGTYRTGHETWAVRYLERFLDDAGERSAPRRVGRAVSALLSLADDPDLRESVVRAVGDGDPALDAVVADPTGWADDRSRSVLSVGTEYPKLAQLFGTGERATVTLPEACSETARARCLELRARMHLGGGDLSAAENEYERLAEAAADLETGADRFAMESLLGRSRIARRQGDHDAAAELVDDALAVSERLDSLRDEVRCRVQRGRIAESRGEYDDARIHLTEALATAEDADVDWNAPKGHEILGNVERSQRNYDEARAEYDRALAAYRGLGDRKGEAVILASLGRVAFNRGDIETARERAYQSLEIAREIGDVGVQLDCLDDLGNIGYAAESFDEAARYFQQGLELARETGERVFLPGFLFGLGNVAMETNDFESAREHYTQALDRARETDSKSRETAIVRCLAYLHYRCGDFEAARDAATEALELARSLGDPRFEIEAQCFHAMPALETGDFDEATERLEAALSLARDIDHPEKLAEVRHLLAAAARKRGDLDAATEFARDSLATYEEIDTARGQADCRETLGRALHERGEIDRAAEQFERASEAGVQDGKRVDLLVSRSRLARTRNEYDRAGDLADSAVTLAEESAYARHPPLAYVERGAVARDLGEHATAADHLDRGLEAARDAGYRCTAVRGLYEYGLLDRERGDEAAARDRLEEAADAAMEMGWAPMATRVVRALGDVADPQTVAEWRERVAELDCVGHTDLQSPTDADEPSADLSD